MPTVTKLFYGIDELLTLAQVAKKDGRNIEEKDLSIIKQGALAVENGLISWVGKKSEIPKGLKKKAKAIDLKGGSLLPGWVECHTHLVFAGDRSDEFEMRNQGASYQEIAAAGGGIAKTVEKTRKCSLENLKEIAQTRVDRFLSQGVTTLEVKSGYGLNRKDEIKILKVIRELKGPTLVPTFLGAHSFPKEQSPADYQAELMRMLEEIKKLKIAQRVDIFVEKGYFDLSWAEVYLSKAQALGFQLTLHSDQLSASGANRLAVKLKAHSADHLVEITDNEIPEFAQSPVTAVLLPTADFYLRMKYPPARRLIDQGARVALATDFNPGSSPTQDLSFVGVLARVMMGMKLPEVLAAYTFNAAKALGLSESCGSLEVGKRADFISVSHWRELFYQVGHHPVSSVWQGGRKAKIKT